LRNFCAHHSRLWNRQFGITIKIPPRRANSIADQMIQRSRNLYNTLVILLYIMDTIAPKHHLRSRLLKLVSENPQTLNGMGFPDSWHKLNIWQDQ